MHLRAMINAIVTLYNPDASVIEHVKEYAAQTDRVILCDNSSDDHSEMFKDIPSVVYTTEYKNLGLSGAFNRVLKDQQYGWSDDDYVIFFDQDSSIKEGHISSLIAEFRRLLKKKIKVGCISPAFYNLDSNELFKQNKIQKIDEKTFVIDSTQTSSMLTRYKILRDIDFWNDD